jgi:hypothetical protein
MANPTMTLIASNTVGSGSTSSVTFSSIPATYTDLMVKLSTRGSQSAVYSSIYYYFNGLTANRNNIVLEGSGSTVYSVTAGSGGVMYASAGVGATATASTFGNAELYIPNYTSSNYKSSSVDGISENNATTTYLDIVANLWSNTAAITSLTFVTETSQTIAQYSTFYLYGIKNN